MAPDVEPDVDPDDPWIGQTLASYTILSRLGQGGMGVVYLAQHQSLHRKAAIKFLPSDLVSSPGYIEMFLREADAAASLNHTNIVGVYDAGHLGEDIYYFIMEYVKGNDLHFLLEEKGALPVDEAVQYIRQAASALGHAHKKHIIHRDIKPENLLLTPEGIIKVADLGLAKWVGTESSMMTQSGETFGSPLFMSPERLKDPEHIDARTDIYSLGGTFYQLITGQAPYQGTAAVVMSLHLLGPVPDPQEVDSHIDSQISQIVKRMMAKEPADRYQTMEEVDDALAEYQASVKSAPPRKDVPTKRHATGSKSNPVVVTGAILAILAAVGSTVWFLKRESGTPVRVVTPAPAPAVKSMAGPSKPTSGETILFDFEDGVQDWRLDWGDADAGPAPSQAQAHHGKKTIAYTHDFQRGSEQVAGVVTFPSPKNFTGIKEIGAWVFLPEGKDWEIQIYIRSGDSAEPQWGKIQRNLKGGWHRAVFDTKGIKDIKSVNDLGVQVKRFTSAGQATVYIDQVETVAE